MTIDPLAVALVEANPPRMVDGPINGIRCLVCGVTVISHHRHDYRTCDCAEGSGSRVSVDGGPDYVRRGYSAGSRWVELSDGRERRGDEP